MKIKKKKEKKLMLLTCPLTFNRMQSAKQEFAPSTKKCLFFVVLFSLTFLQEQKAFLLAQRERFGY